MVERPNRFRRPHWESPRKLPKSVYAGEFQAGAEREGAVKSLQLQDRERGGKQHTHAGKNSIGVYGAR